MHHLPSLSAHRASSSFGSQHSQRASIGATPYVTSSSEHTTPSDSVHSIGNRQQGTDLVGTAIKRNDTHIDDGLCEMCTPYLAYAALLYLRNHHPDSIALTRLPNVDPNRESEILEQLRANTHQHRTKSSCWLCCRIGSFEAIAKSEFTYSPRARTSGNSFSLFAAPNAFDFAVLPNHERFHLWAGMTQTIAILKYKRRGLKHPYVNLATTPKLVYRVLPDPQQALGCRLERLDTHKTELDTCLKEWNDRNTSRHPELLHSSRVELLKHWLKECDCTHHCISSPQAQHSTEASINSPFAGQSHQTARPNAWPPRLLYLKSDDPSEIRLVYTDTLNATNLKYATLSHCWGTDPLLAMLTPENIEDYANGIKISKLDRTFRETVFLCRDLGIDYVWIDCLCIIQDPNDDADWRRHASEMHTVYRHSYLNIAACASEQADKGLIRPIASNLLRRLIVELPGDEAHIEEGLGRILTRNVADSPLFWRGWCVQEIFLAPRTLFFTGLQMYWRCRGPSASETGESFELRRVSYRLRESLNEIDLDKLDRTWIQISENFSSTQVTVPRDRVFALAGLAAWFTERYQRCAKDTRYVLGTWTHSFVRNLLWSATASNRALERRPRAKTQENPKVLYFPSWSWLWPSRGVHFFNSPQSRRPLVQYYLSELVNLESADDESGIAFGPIVDAKAHMRACLVTVRTPSRSSKIQDSKYREINFDADARFYRLDGQQLSFDWDSEQLDPLWCNSQIWADPWAEDEDLSQDILLMPIAYSKYTDGECQFMDGLVLSRNKCEPPDPDDPRGLPKYERMAAFSISLVDRQDLGRDINNENPTRKISQSAAFLSHLLASIKTARESPDEFYLV